MPSTTRLRLKIIATLLIVLGLAMLLINLVLLRSQQKNLIELEMTRATEQARQLTFFLAQLQEKGSATLTLPAELPGRLLSGQGELWHDSLPQDIAGLEEAVKRQEGLALKKNKLQASLLRTTFTPLGRRYRALIVCNPLPSAADQPGTLLTLVTDLRHLEQKQLQSQRLVFFYFLLNLSLLTFFAYLRLTKITVRPLQRLAKRAEEYRDEDDFLLFGDKRLDDFGSLSSSLNSMVRRINTDRDKLQQMVHELEKANASLLQAQEEVIQAEKLASVGRLSAGIAHEIGNPIGIVLGYLELLQQDDLPLADRQDCLQRAMAEIQRINTILRQLLDLARPDKHGIQRIDIHELLDDVCQGLALQPMLKGLRLQQQLAPGSPQVEAEGEKIRQVFLNLIMNAADACRKTPQAQLKISTAVDQGWLTIHFQDNGPGIAEQHVKNIFDPFYTTKDPGQGTGLGLSVSYMIISACRGKITVDSAGLAQGTTFTIQLPLASPETAKSSPS